MRKHNKTFATRWTREKGDRSNFPQSMAHASVNNKGNQLFANRTLALLFDRCSVIPKRPREDMADIIAKAEAALSAGTEALQGATA